MISDQKGFNIHVVELKNVSNQSVFYWILQVSLSSLEEDTALWTIHVVTIEVKVSRPFERNLWGIFINYRNLHGEKFISKPIMEVILNLLQYCATIEEWKQLCINSTKGQEGMASSSARGDSGWIFRKRVVRHWNSLPEEVVESLEVFRKCVGMALRVMV